MKNLKRNVLDQVVDYLNKQNYTWEVFLSDDGSTDGTTEELKKFAQNNKNVEVVENIHAGKGPTVQSGMLKAKGEWILFTDFDQSTPLKEIEKLLKYKDKYQVVIGSREIEGAKRDKEPFHRHLMGKGFNLLVQALAIPGIYDTQCGFKLFSAKASHDIFSNLIVYGRSEERPDAFTGAFDVEALFIARKKGLKVKEVPIIWHHNETDRVSPVKDSLRMLRDIIKVRFTDLLGKYSK
ncbi:MAG: glycosyltransferase [Candidatus Pacebacteria bacterium]|nr:glycosyltransferase [Candidatus Paceibacterota bacterium]